MDEILSIKQLIKMLSNLPAGTPFLNAPTKPYAYLKTKDIAFVVGETIFDQNPPQTVGEIVELLQKMIGREYHVGSPLKENSLIYLVSHMHKAGEGLLGFKMTSRGIALIKASKF